MDSSSSAGARVSERGAARLQLSWITAQAGIQDCARIQPSLLDSRLCGDDALQVCVHFAGVVVSEARQVRVRDFATAHQHFPVFGAAIQGRDHLARIEQPLGVKGALDAKHLLVFRG